MHFLLFHILNFDIIYKSVLGVRRYLVVSFFCFVNVVIFKILRFLIVGGHKFFELACLISKGGKVHRT